MSAPRCSTCSRSCNLVSVSKVSEKGKVTEFNKYGCWLKKSDGTVAALAMRHGSLYLLDCQPLELAYVAGLNEDLWHRRYSHLGNYSLRQFACAEGNHHKSLFPTGGGARAEDVLDLVHTDVCGKLSPRSIGGAEYFVTFIDDKSRYVYLPPKTATSYPQPAKLFAPLLLEAVSRA